MKRTEQEQITALILEKEKRIRDLESVIRTLVSKLPTPPDGWTGHAYEGGYARWTTVDDVFTTDDGHHAHLFTDGWDDMSEDGGYIYLTDEIDNPSDQAPVYWQMPEHDHYD